MIPQARKYPYGPTPAPARHNLLTLEAAKRTSASGGAGVRVLLDLIQNRETGFHQRVQHVSLLLSRPPSSADDWCLWFRVKGGEVKGAQILHRSLPPS